MNNMERLTIPDEPIEGGMRRAIIDVRSVKKEAMTLYWALKKYEDTGLTPDDILNLIDETPSAYDTDKVVEQLEKRIKDAEKVIVKNPADKLDEIVNETSEAFIEAYKDAIEIVKEQK